MAALPAVPPPPQVLQRRRRRVLLLAAIVVSLCGLACCYMLAVSLRAIFITEFRLVNGSGEDLRVTPIGMSEGPGWYMPLPAVRGKWAPLPHRSACRLPLPARASLPIIYDWDDVNFRHVLIEEPGGNVYLMDTDKKGNLDFCYANQQDEYHIPPLAKLPRAPAELLPLLEGKWVHYSGAREYEQRRFLRRPDRQ